MSKIVTLMTDFGYKDAYTGVMKGVIINIIKDVDIIDLTHNIDPYNITSAAYILYTAWDYFPKGAVFITVVDPGVGSLRKEIITMVDGKYLITPDNGILSLLFKKKGKQRVYQIKKEEIYKITKRNFSPTFHGRDIFAPAGAIILKYGLNKISGIKIDPLIINDFNLEINKDCHVIKGKIIHIDRFGNCITSISREDTRELILKNILNITKRKIYIKNICKNFTDTAVGGKVIYWGSSGFLEIAVRNGNACKSLKLSQGDEVVLC